MKLLKFIAAILVFAFLAWGCEEDDPVNNETEGTLKFSMTTWNASNAKSPGTQGKTVHTVDIVDIQHLIPLIEVTTDSIYAGGSLADVTWVTMYESSVEMLHTEREVTLKMPVGKYTGIKLVQRNLMGWVLDFQGNNIVAWVPNNSTLGDNDTLVNFFGADGLFGVDQDGKFVSAVPTEKLGSFEIKPGQVTNLLMRLNFTTVDWDDKDDSGDWSPLDELNNHQLPTGVTTMTDFIVTYE